MNKVDDEWFSIENKKPEQAILQTDDTRLDALEKKQKESESLIRALQESVAAFTKLVLQLQNTLVEKEKQLTINTHQPDAKELLEELKVLKERELNRMLREHRPIPFVPYHSSTIASGLAQVHSFSHIMPLTPLIKRMSSPRISPMVGSSLLSKNIL